MDHKRNQEIEPIRAAFMKYRGDAAKANSISPMCLSPSREKQMAPHFFLYQYGPETDGTNGMAFPL
ncbi:MAG: hypothetical protein ACLRMZ_02270 [Blautia marasmi]